MDNPTMTTLMLLEAGKVSLAFSTTLGWMPGRKRWICLDHMYLTEDGQMMSRGHSFLSEIWDCFAFLNSIHGKPKGSGDGNCLDSEKWEKSIKYLINKISITSFPSPFRRPSRGDHPDGFQI
jgi:hypothetical protein